MTEEKLKEKNKEKDNIIFVGNKPHMSYVPVVIAILNSDKYEEVILKARGNAISRAVDTAEIVRNRFLTGTEIKDIKIGTEPVTNSEGRNSNVSSMEISLNFKK